MKGFSRHGSTSAASRAGEEAVGSGVVAVVERGYCAGIAPEVPSSLPANDGGCISRLEAEDKRGDLGRGQHGDEEEEAELELGLSLGVKKATANSSAVRNAAAGGGSPWGEYCRILTAKDFPYIAASRGSSISPSSSTASSSPSLGGNGVADAGRTGVGVTRPKRLADSAASEVVFRTPSQVVGWPPIRAYRMNNLINHSKDSDEVNHIKNDSDNGHHDKATRRSATATIQRKGIREHGTHQELEKTKPVGGSLFVKVNTDGDPIGRKVDLNAHHTYETLALALEDMFEIPSSLHNPIRNARTSNLLDGSSEFVLTYEDKDGDWMLVGDVPWGMFLSTVKRLRIMRTSDATGLGPRCLSTNIGVLRKNHI